MEHLKEADRLKENPGKKDRSCFHLNSAINKYGVKEFKLKQIDTACTQKELDEKEIKWINEYDSMNPEKGYNMTEGGKGGRLRPEIIEELSSISKKNWKDPDYIKKQREAKTIPEYIEKEREGAEKNWKNPNYIKKQKETRATPEFKEKMSEARKKDWKNPDYVKKQKETRATPEFKEKVSKNSKKNWKDPNFIKKHREKRATSEYKEKMSKA